MLTLNLQNILTQRPLGLVFDIDGTLSPIAPTPDEAELYPGVVSLLKEAREYAHVAIISGRAIDDAARLINIKGLTYIGTHGLEWSDGLPWLHPVHIVSEALAYVRPGEHLLDLTEQKFSDLPEIIVERKRIGGAVHYRLHPQPEQARKMILSLLEEPARQANMHLSEGKRVIEIKTPLAVDKGLALRRFVQRLGLHGVIFAGDDRTDLDAIREIPRFRQEGIAALAIVVKHADTLLELIKHADIVVGKETGMVELLHEIVEFLEKCNSLYPSLH